MSYKSNGVMPIACEKKRFSSLFATGNVSHRGTSVSQRQNFHIDDVNEGFHNNSGSHGVPNANLFNFISPGRFW